MQWLFAKTDQVTADTIVDDTLLCEISPIELHLVNTNTWRNYH